MPRTLTIASAVQGDDNARLGLDFDDDGQGNQVLLLRVLDGSKNQEFKVDRQGHIWNESHGDKLYLTRDPFAVDPSIVLLKPLDKHDDSNQVWNFKAGPVRVPGPDGKYTLIVTPDDAQADILQAAGVDQLVTLVGRDPAQQPPGQSWYDAADK